MANSLLDFVMALVRDPDAAARYAADPAAAIAEANLTDVSSVDVSNLIPVVSESLSMASPVAGFDTVGAEPAGNVWASGAATAAFDAFDASPTDWAHQPAVIDTQSVITDTVGDNAPDDFATDPVEGVAWPTDPASPQFDAPAVDDVAALGTGIADDWSQPAVDGHSDALPGGFDLFD